jgi:hypothetical protein
VRRSLISLVMVLVLLPADSNIAADALPAAWQPWLWLAWPIGVLLAVPLIYGEIRARRHPEVVAEQGKRLNLAAHWPARSRCGRCVNTICCRSSA